MKFTTADNTFLDSLNNTGVVASNIYFTAKHAGYMRNLDRDKVKQLEAIYKRVFDQPKFSLCYHCNGDVMKMVIRLYDAQAKEAIEPELVFTPALNPAANNPIMDIIEGIKPPKPGEYERVGNVIQKTKK